MAFEMIPLPYEMNALEPAMSKKTLEFHYGKHYKKYVTTTNELTAGTQFEKLSLEDVIKESANQNKKLVNNAAQAWNHAFFWNCLTPKKAQPSEKVSSALKKSFGSVDEFKAQFSKAAGDLFGSGWAWLVQKPDGSLAIEALGNAENPIVKQSKALLTCDVWEHAYYLDYQNERPNYVKAFWEIVNWNFLEENMK